MMKKVRACRNDLWSLQLERALVEGEVVEMDVDLVDPLIFEWGYLEILPDDYVEVELQLELPFDESEEEI